MLVPMIVHPLTYSSMAVLREKEAITDRAEEKRAASLHTLNLGKEAEM